MIIRHAAILIAFIMLSTHVADANKDMILPWAEVRIVSPGQDDTGQIIVTATSDGTNWMAFEIEAYAKKFHLDQKQLASLKGYPLKSLDILYAPHDDEKPVFVTVSKTEVVFSPQEGRQVITTDIALSVTRSHGLVMGDPHKTIHP